MTYTAYWYRYPHGKETDTMFAQSKEFDNLEKAIEFIRRKAQKTLWQYWAGATVQDEQGNYMIEMGSDCKELMWYDDIKEGEVTGKTERQKEFGVTDRGYLQGFVMNDFLANSDAFLAKIATLDPGEYQVEELCDLWGYLDGWIFTGKFYKLSSELSNRMPEYFSYIGDEDTGVLTVKNPSESVDQSEPISPKDVNPSDEKECKSLNSKPTTFDEATKMYVDYFGVHPMLDDIASIYDIYMQRWREFDSFKEFLKYTIDIERK